MRVKMTLALATTLALVAGGALAQTNPKQQSKPGTDCCQDVDHGAMMDMNHGPMMHDGMEQAQAGQEVTGTGTVKKVDAASRTVNLAHDPIPAINWPAMVMDFQVARGVDLNGLRPGQVIEFVLVNQGGAYLITAIKPKT